MDNRRRKVDVRLPKVEPAERIALALETMVREQSTGILAKLAAQADRIEAKLDKILTSQPADLSELTQRVSGITETVNSTTENLRDAVDENQTKGEDNNA